MSVKHNPISDAAASSAAQPRVIALMTFVGAVVLVLVIAGSARGDGAGVVWSPTPRPTECATVDAELLALDSSASVSARGMFQPAKDQVFRYLEVAHSCSYIIVARFARTFDVVADGFLLSEDDRRTLQGRVKTIQPVKGRTNLDEAAKGIDYIELQLQRTFADRYSSLSVRVFTDDQSDPDPEKGKFSLKQFFERRRGKVATFSEITMMPAGGKISGELPRTGYAAVLVPVDRLAEVLQPPAKVVPPPEKDIQATPDPTLIVNSSQSSRWTTAAGAVLGAMLVLGAGLSLWRRWSDLPEPLEEDGSRKDVALSFTVTESETPAENVDTIAGNVVSRQRIAAVPNLPLVFGTNPDRHTIVVGPGGVESASGELFRVTPVGGNMAYVELFVDGKCNGESIVEGERTTVTTAQPICVTVGRREWRIAESRVEDEEVVGAHALFARRRDPNVNTDGVEAYGGFR